MLVRRLLTPVVALLLTVGSLAYAAVDDDTPIDSVQETAEDLPETVLDDDDAVQDDQPTVSPESDEEVVPTDDGTVNDGTGEAAPVAEEEGSHGPERSTQGCPQGFFGNHGKYVSGTEERPRKDAAHSECGKPVHDEDKVRDDGAEDDDSAPEEVPGS